MPHEENTLVVNVRECDGGYEAKLCDLNLAVRAETPEKIRSELAHALTVVYEMACELKESPFVRFVRRLSPIEVLQRQQAEMVEFGHIHLSADVALALASALQKMNPLQEVALFKSAA